MKSFVFPIDAYQAAWMFRPVRSRRDIVTLLMKSIKVMLVNSPPKAELVVGSLVLNVSKMSRIFYLSLDKIVSIAFPFFVTKVGDEFQFSSHSHPSIDSQATSSILELVEGGILGPESGMELFLDSVLEGCGEKPELWRLFRDTLTFEDGYVRYDFDTEHEDGHMHPLNHLDIFYSTASTFKLGLETRIDSQQLRDILDLTSNCHYLVPVK